MYQLQPDLYESPYVSKLRLGAQCDVEDDGNIDGNHGDHVNNVERMVEELPLVRREEQPCHHLGGTENKKD